MKNTNWAYGAYTMNSAELGVGTVYYGKNYFAAEGNAIYNPNTGSVYTADQLKAIVNGATNGAEGYLMQIPDDAIMGISVNSTDTVYWYNTVAGRAILSHTDALILNDKTGELTTAANGEAVATPIQ